MMVLIDIDTWGLAAFPKSWQTVLLEGSGLRFSVFAGAEHDLHGQAESGEN